MIHVLFEFMPFLGGCAYGFIAPRTGWRNLWPNLLIGALGSWLAGELAGGGGEAALALFIDSATAFGGCLLIRFARRFARRFAAGRQS